LPVNGQIRSKTVLVIDQDGVKKGVMSIDDAIVLSQSSGNDLVQVSPNDANQVVCKIMDYGKFVFEKKKNASSKTKTKKPTLKEIKFRPSTDIGDYKIKLKKIRGFINDGNKTKISVRFRGREILNSNIGLELLKNIKNEVDDIANVEQEPSLEGRQLLMVLSPLKKNN